MWISKHTVDEDTDSCVYPSDSDLEASPLYLAAAAGSYQPAVGLAAARALRFVAYDVAVSTVRALQGASHEDLRLRVHELSSSIKGVFFNGGLEPEKAPPFSTCVRFPEGALFVCADRAPLAPALREATRAMMQVAVKDASDGPCHYYYEAVLELMLLLVGDAGRPAPDVVFSRETFELAFKLEWVPAPDAVVDDAAPWISKDKEDDADSCIYPSDLEANPFAAAGGSYQPAVGLATAGALRFVPYDEAMATVRALQGASHEDLRLRAHELSSSLSGVFFNGGLEPEKAPPFSAGVRFPEGALFVCADRAPLAPALREAARAMTQVAVKDVSHGPCDYYYDVVRELMLLLVGDAGRPAPDVVFSRETFASAFALQWVPAPDAVVDDAAL